MKNKILIYLALTILLALSVTASNHSVTIGSTTTATSSGANPFSIIINSPADNTTVAGDLIVNFRVVSLDGGISCDLLINGSIEDTNASIIHNATTTLTYTPSAAEASNWQLSCGGNGINGTIQTPFFTFDTAPTSLTINVRNIQTLAHLTNVTINITNTATLNSTIYNGTTSPLVVGLDPGTYNVSVSQNPFYPQSQLITLLSGDSETLNFNLGFDASFNLFDERTLQVFNISSPDDINFHLFCPNSTVITPVTNSTFTVPITCQYTKFKFVLDYGPTNYYRTFIIDPDDTLGVNVYLIDLATTNAIFNNFIVDDLLQEYDNVRVHIRKVFVNQTDQINADFVDIENSVGAFLIENHEYIVEIHSDNNPVRVLGTYVADTAGNKNLRLYDINLNGSLPLIGDTIRFHTRNQEVNGTLSYILEYEDLANATNAVSIELRTGSIDGPVVYTDIITSSNFEEVVDIQAYNDTQVYSIVVVDHQELGTLSDNRIIYDVVKIGNAAIDYIEANYPKLLTWFLIIILSAIAIMATASNGDMTAIGVLLLAALFVGFGWLTTYNELITSRLTLISVIALGILVATISLLKKGDRRIV